MKKTLLFLFLSYSAFSQVFQLDTTFKFQPIKKQYNAIYPIVNPLSDTLLNIIYEGNIYHDKSVASGNLLVNKDGRLVRALAPTATPYFDFRNQYSLITPEGKYYRVQMRGYGYMLQRFNQAGDIDTTFNFPVQKDAILQCFLLHNGNLLVNVPNATPASADYQIIDGTGKLIRGFSLTDYGFSAKAWLKSVAFNESGEYYLYIYLNEEPRVAEVIKTNKDLVRDNTFQKITVSPALYDVSKSKIGVYKNSIYLYSANPDETKNSIEKYANAGKKIWQADFGRISGNYSSGPTFYHQQDESLALIYMDNKHLRIKADGKVDSVFYQNKAQQEVAFLHSFNDGSYWVMRNKSGLIEKMYADGSIDANFKISTRLEKTLVPNRIEKQTNNYLVELIDLPSFANSPYSFRIPINATCLRVYNQQHQLLYDFFDSKTIWQTYKTKDALIIRGDGKFYTIDSKAAMTTSADTLQTNDVIDWENRYIYRLLSDNLLARYKIGAGRDDSFRIDLYNGLRIYNFQLLSNGQIAVQGAGAGSTLSFSYTIMLVYKKNPPIRLIIILRLQMAIILLYQLKMDILFIDGFMEV